MTTPPTRGLSFEGGAVKGLHYIGALEALEQLGWFDQPGKIALAGTSVGAIFAAGIAMGATSADLRQALYRFPLHKVAGPAWQVPFRYPRYLATGGLWSNKWLGKLVDEVLECGDRTFRPNLHSLSVIITDERAGRAEVVGLADELWPPNHAFVRNRPWTLRDTVLASASIPIVWPAVERRWSDGGLAWNDPITALGLPPAACLGFRVDTPQEVSGRGYDGLPRSLVGRTMRLFKIARAAANDQRVPDEYWRQIVRLRVADDSPGFGISRTKIEAMIEEGRKQTTQRLMGANSPWNPTTGGPDQ